MVLPQASATFGERQPLLSTDSDDQDVIGNFPGIHGTAAALLMPRALIAAA
jgi:hypothetical protein